MTSLDTLQKQYKAVDIELGQAYVDFDEGAITEAELDNIIDKHCSLMKHLEEETDKDNDDILDWDNVPF